MSSHKKTDQVFRAALALTVMFTMYDCFIVSNAAHILSKVHVHVYNSIAPNKSMDIQCRSRDDNLGHRTLLYGQYYALNFRVNLWGTTLFWCSMEWNDDRGSYMDGSFKIYAFKRDASRCDKTCVWRAQQDGVYFVSPQRNHIPQLMFTWAKPSTKTCLNAVSSNQPDPKL